ncbi:hypothetical protein WQ57_04750 [Mesobacillus campisalis]|uniref:Uncharacterized protein n=1 Tax=Mesobacillus campisalis TaxID=1408103 RepID=A0A0M2T1I8_9BACI|nr:hypothetical protein [Mesobacillus campisalis]KKK39097.1 hypothetical protein WQ57_04750 [Mesobacillus campisalis]
MNKYLKLILGFLAAILVGIGLLVAVFIFEMKPDKDEEEKIKIQAEQYVKEKFNDDFEIYDVLYDNMGNFEFEYAVKVRDKKTHTQFLIYYDDETNQMVDTYRADKWADDLETEIRPFIKETFGEPTDLFVFFTNENIEFNKDSINPGSYKESKATATIRISISRKRSDEDDKNLNEVISFLKTEVKLKTGSVMIEYITENGEILDDEWEREF